MKKRGSLNGRAAKLTAIATGLVAVAVCMFAVFLAAAGQADTSACRSAGLLSGSLAEAAREDPDDPRAALETTAAFVRDQGGAVWLMDFGGAEYAEECLTGDTPLPNLLNDGVKNDTPDPVVGVTFRRDGRRFAYAEARLEGGTWDKVAVALPIQKPDDMALAKGALPAILLGLAAGLLVRGVQKKAEKKLEAGRKAAEATRAAVAALRDTAVSMAEGHLEMRADESRPGEIGELGKAVNNLSHQLSRNMYTLIVERNRLKNLLNGLSEGIVAIDANGQITHTNPALDRMFTRQKRVLHLPDPRMKLIPDKSVWEDFDGVIRSGESMTRNLESKDMILRLTVTPIVDEIGEVAGAVGLFSDITQMERLEKTRRDYVSNVSHELRTPLTAMQALVEPLRDRLVTDEKDRMRYYGIILREIERLTRLINDQLELSRLQSGTTAIEKRVMRLDDLIYDVCDRYGAIAAEHHLELNVETDFSKCPEVFANEDRVEQLLIILLDNAIKYTDKGSVNVSGTWDDDKVVLSVRDTGVGIEEVDLPYVFDRFYKVDKAHTGKGSGLGLSIAKEVMKRMDEEIWVTSEKGKGTQFSFTVHRPKAQKEAPEAGSEN